MAILLLAEHDNKQLDDSCFRTISAALRIGKEIDLLVIGYRCQNVAEEASGLSAVRRVLLVDDVIYQRQPEELVSHVVQQSGAGYSHILCSSSPFGEAVLPRVAALMDVAQISNVSTIHSTDTFTRPIYAGQLLSKVRSKDEVKIITIMASAFPAAREQMPETGRKAAITATPVSAAPLPCYSRFITEQKHAVTRRSMKTASTVLAVGRGMKVSEESSNCLDDLADKLDAAIGGTRPVVEAGWLPGDAQIGQTSQSIAPELYIGLGVSGAAQHVAGIKDSKVIVAINKDAEAPIFKLANYGLVADVNKVLSALTKLL